MNFIIYDLEATCWLGRPPHGVNEVIEIGAIKMNPYGEEIGRFSKFVKPKMNPVLSHFCKQLTSIQQEDIDRALGFPKVIEVFKNWIDIYEDQYLLCSWGGFDEVLLKNDCNLHGLETDWLAQCINVKKQYHNYKRSEKERGLKTSIQAEGFDFGGNHHRAISDAENLAKIFSRYIDIWQY